MKKIFTLFAALAMVMSMSAAPYLKGSFNGWGEGNSLSSGSTTVTLNANATYEFKVNDGSNWYGNNGTMTSTNCTDWTMSTSGGNCKIKTTIAGVYTFKWNASSKKLSVVYPTEAVEINYYITGSGNLVGGDGWKANEIKMTNNDGTYTYTFTNLAAGNYEMKITQGNWDNTLGFSNLATSYVGVTGNNDNNIIMALADATNLTVTVTGTTVSLSLPEKTNTIYFVNEKGWAKVNAYVWTDNPYKPWPGEAMTKVEGKTYGGKDVYTYTYPANNSKVIFNDGGSNQTGDLTYSEATPYYYNDKWNASIAYDKAKYTVTVTAENGTVTGAGEYEEGKEATLTATAAEGYEFVNWTKGEEVVSTENPYKFTVTADVALVANFKLIPPTKYTVTVTATAEGENVVSGGGEYEDGEEVKVTASEDLEGWVFIGWTEDGEFVANDPEYTFVVKGDVELVAVYAADLGENKVTDLVIDGDNMLLTGSVADFQMGTMNLELALGEYNEEEGKFLLTEESKLYVGETNFTFVDGMAAVDMDTNSAMAIVVFEHNGAYFHMTVNMSAAAAEPIVVVVENATLDDQVESTGFFYMAGECTIDGVIYPVKAEIPSLDKTKAEAEYENVMVEVGTWEGEYLGNATGTATVSVVDNVVTLTGVIENPMTHVAFDVTISGTLSVEEPEVIAYELNGGEFPAVVVPTNEELALAFKQDYAEYFAIEGLTDTDMKREVGNFIYVTNSKGGDAIKFITENANWKWLHDYILTVAGNIPEGTNVGFYWRANLDGFFHCKNAVAVGGVASADYTVAGKPEAWGAAYQAAHAVVLPTEPVDAPYTLPTPVKEGYKFVGWYDNAEGTGEPMTVIPAGWDGTLYAIWVEIYTITVEAENGTVEGAGNYEHGAEATLTATAAEGYEFTCWTSGKDTVSTANPYKFTVTADVALVANFKEAAPTYDLELVAKDLYSASDEVKTQFEGSNSLNPDMTISVTLFASKYGTYTSTGAEEDEFNAFYAGSQILGELTYSYSDELKSDLVVIIGTITDEEETSTIKVTMYEEYLEPTDVVVLNNLQKNVQKMGWMSNLMLFNAANDTIITISGCDGTYGKYSAWGTFGADELEGKGEWKNDGENDVFVGVLYNADKTKVFQVTATTPAEKIKEYTYELADVSFTLSEASNTLIIEAYAEEPEPVQVYLELAGWTPEQTIYAVGEMCGSIANMDNIEGADVANLTYEVESYLEGKELTITAQVEDATGNTYLLILTGEYDSTTTALDNLNTTVAPVKMIENGQLIIINNGVQFNAQGQVIK